MNSFLIIDDDDIFNSIFTKTVSLVDASAEVVSLESSREGLNYIIGLQEENQSMPRFVFIDINMPEMTGFEMIEKVAEQAPSAFTNSDCYILSTSLDERDIQRANKYSFIKGFKSKPLSLSTLREIIGA